MVNYLLSENAIYPWTNYENIKFRGYFFIGNDLYRGREAVEKIKNMIDDSSFDDTISQLNGAFSVIYESQNKVMIAVDVIRSLPLFYSKKDGAFIISDNANLVYDELECVTFDKISVEEFKSTERFVTGPNTLFCQIKQVQAGEIVELCKMLKKIKRYFYYDYSIRDIKVNDFKELSTEFERVFTSVSNRLTKLLDGRTAVVPLTGGTDSRELLFMLYKVGYKNVVCFTVGKKGNREAKIAEKIAEHFNYKWYNVDYTRKKWRDYSKSKDIQTYRKYCSNFSSLPHFLDILAVKELKGKGIIPLDSIFIPGHTGVINGGNLIKEFLEPKVVTFDRMKEVSMKQHYKNLNISDKLVERINSYFKNRNCKTNNEMEAQVFSFEMKERQAKFICNSIRVYEFLEYEWLLPLCDREFLEFMKRVPLNLKFEKKFIRDYIGIKTIESTSDDTIYVRVSRFIRDISPIRIAIRKASKIIKYFTDILQTGGLYGFRQYIKVFIRSNENFTVNTIECRVYLNSLREKSDNK